MSNRPESEVSLSAIYDAVLTHRRLACLALATVLGLTAGWVLLSAPQYRSEGKLLVRLGRENLALDPTATVGQEPKVVVPANREGELRSIVEILESRVMREQVVARLGAAAILEATPWPSAAPDSASPYWVARRVSQQANDPATSEPLTGADEASTPEELELRERAIQSLESRLLVSIADKSNIITLSFDAPRPDLAQQVLSTYLDVYLNRHQEIHRSPDAYRFLREQADEVRSQLVAAEDQLRALQSRTGLASIDQQRAILVERIARLEDRLLDSQTALSSAQAEQDDLRKQLAGLPVLELDSEVSGLSDPAADAMRQEVFNLQMDEQAMLALYRPESQEAEKLRRKIAQARQILESEAQARGHQTSSRGRAHQEVQLALITKQTEVQSLLAAETALRRQRDAAHAGLETLSDDAVQMKRLQREIELQDAQYRLLANNLQQAETDRLLEAQRISNLSVVQPPTFQPQPVNRHRSLILAGGLLSAILAAVGVALAAEQCCGTLKTEQDVYREIGLPTLVTLPQLSRVAD